MGFIRYLRESHKVSVIYMTIVLILLMFFLEPAVVSGPVDSVALTVIPFTLVFLTFLTVAYIIVKVETKAAKRMHEKPSKKKKKKKNPRL